MPKYVIPITFMITAEVPIEADNLKEAIDITVNGSLPVGDYIDESIRMQFEDLRVLNPTIEDKEIEEVYKEFNNEYWFEDWFKWLKIKF